MKKEKGKAMSDGEVNDFAFKKLIGDLGGIEADGLFKEDEPESAVEGGGPGGSLKIEITHSMGGAQTKEQPKVLPAPEDDDEESVLGD